MPISFGLNGKVMSDMCVYSAASVRLGY